MELPILLAKYTQFSSQFYFNSYLNFFGIVYYFGTKCI